MTTTIERRLLQPHNVASIRRDVALGYRGEPTLEYGPAEMVMGTGRATCRCCGTKIQKGQAALRFAWDFHGCGSFTAGLVQIHVGPCVPARS